MIAQLNDISQIWWQWMGSMFWQVSLLILLITALDMAIRRWAWPQLRYALWGLVFMKLIIPPTWQMPTSIVSWIQPQVEEQMSIQIGTLVWSENNLEMPVSSEFSQDKGKEPGIIKETKTKVTWQTFALAGWIAGMAIFSLMLIRKMSQFRKSHQLQEGGEIPEWFHELMSKTAQRLKLKKTPSIILSKDAKSPAVYGVFEPVLLLPDGYLDQLSREQAEHVLIHELCHLKRGDVWVHWFCIVLQIVYWFNPLLIWTRRQMRYVCEICCDLSVANILREKTRAYRNTLLNTARELFTERLEPGLGFLGIFEEPFRLVPRLKWLEKKTWENRKLKIISTICTSLFMVACVMPMSKTSQKIETKQTKNIIPEIRISKKADTGLLDVEFPDTDVTTVLMELNKFTEDNIILDPDIEGRMVSMVLNDVPWDQALELVLKNTGLEKKYVEKNILWVTTKEKMTQIIAEEKEKAKDSIKTESKSLDEGSDISTLVDQALRHLTLQQINHSIADLKVRINETKAQLIEYETIIEGTPKKEKRFLSLNRDYKKLKDLYERLLQRKLEAELAISMERKQAQGKSTEMDKKQVLGTQTFLANELESVVKRLLEKEEEIAEYRKNYESRLPEDQQKDLTTQKNLAKLIKDYNTLKDLYNTLLQRRLEAELAISMERKQAQGKSTEMDKKQVLGTQTFLANELESVEKRLLEKEEELTEYRKNYESSLPEDLKENLINLDKLQKNLDHLNINLRDIEIKRSTILKDIKDSDAPKDRGEILKSLKKHLSVLESRYRSEHPDIIRLKDIIAGLEAEE